MEFLLLGLLLLSPITGYELQQFIKQNLSLICSHSAGSVQTALAKLEKEEKITSSVSTEGKCRKKTFSITPAGRAAFEGWVVQPMQAEKMKNMELSRLFFLGLAKPAQHIDAIRAYIQQLEQTRAVLSAIKQRFALAQQGELPPTQNWQEVFRFQGYTLDYGFDEFLRNTIQNADGFVYAFTISDHYTHSSFKCFDDRQFCNGHRTVTHGTPIAYIISGDYRYEANLRMIVEGRSEVGGNYLCGVATDEESPAQQLSALAKNLAFAMDKKLTRPANFYGVGGMKIFRDLIYIMQGLMKADHKFYKQHGIYDFPQKQKKRILQMKLVGALISIPSVQKKAKNQMSQAIIAPYQKVIENVLKERSK